jgi:hypothetical protein
VRPPAGLPDSPGTRAAGKARALMAGRVVPGDRDVCGAGPRRPGPAPGPPLDLVVRDAADLSRTRATGAKPGANVLRPRLT